MLLYPLIDSAPPTVQLLWVFVLERDAGACVLSRGVREPPLGLTPVVALLVPLLSTVEEEPKCDEFAAPPPTPEVSKNPPPPALPPVLCAAVGCPLTERMPVPVLPEVWSSSSSSSPTRGAQVICVSRLLTKVEAFVLLLLLRVAAPAPSPPTMITVGPSLADGEAAAAGLFLPSSLVVAALMGFAFSASTPASQRSHRAARRVSLFFTSSSTPSFARPFFFRRD